MGDTKRLLRFLGVAEEAVFSLCRSDAVAEFAQREESLKPKKLDVQATVWNRKHRRNIGDEACTGE